MSNPKEKARELVGFFKSKMVDYTWVVFELRCAKACAIECVNQIDKAIDFDWMEVQNLDREHAFWDEVRKEIEKL